MPKSCQIAIKIRSISHIENIDKNTGDGNQSIEKKINKKKKKKKKRKRESRDLILGIESHRIDHQMSANFATTVPQIQSNQKCIHPSPHKTVRQACPQSLLFKKSNHGHTTKEANKEEEKKSDTFASSDPRRVMKKKKKSPRRSHIKN
jgi:hypothetical protein